MSEEFLPNVGARRLVTLWYGGGFQEGEMAGAIVRLHPEGAGEAEVDALRKRLLGMGALVVRVMPSPAQAKAPLPGMPSGEARARGARAVVGEVVAKMQEARKLEGLEAAVEELATEVGL